MIGNVRIIEHYKLLDIEFFGHWHAVPPHLAVEFANKIISEANKLKEHQEEEKEDVHDTDNSREYSAQR